MCVQFKIRNVWQGVFVLLLELKITLWDILGVSEAAVF